MKPRRFWPRFSHGGFHASPPAGIGLLMRPAHSLLIIPYGCKYVCTIGCQSPKTAHQRTNSRCTGSHPLECRGPGAGVLGRSTTSIRRAELKPSETDFTRVNDQAIRRTLEEAGVEFIDADGAEGPGVRLRQPHLKKDA